MAKATKAERAYFGKVAELGCIICFRPAEIHHLIGLQYGSCKGKKSSDVIPLCPHHHRHGDFGEAVHNGTKTFEERYGTQAELLNKVRRMLGEVN